MTALNEDVKDATELVPQTPLQDAVEGHAAIAESSLTYRYDIEGPGVPREVQRITSVIPDVGFDNLLQIGVDTNLGVYGLDVGRKEFYKALKRLRRVHDILGVNPIPVDVYGFSGSGQTITNGVHNARSLGSGAGIIPGQDLAFCDSGGLSDMTAIEDIDISDSGATLVTVRPLDPAAWGGLIFIARPTVGNFPVIVEDRTHYTERVDTGWVDKTSFTDIPYEVSPVPIAYPIYWNYDVLSGLPVFKGTFRIMGATSTGSAGTDATDITELVLGAAPETGYVYPNFPGPASPLKFLNTGSVTLDLTGVAGIESRKSIKVEYCAQIANEAIPNALSIAPTQTTCQNSLLMASNSAIAGYSGAGDILDVFKNGYFCASYSLLNKDEWEAYAGPCNNTTCRHYAVHESGYIPRPSEINNFWMGAGEYSTQDVAGFPSTTFSRDNYDGILTLLGFPRYNNDGFFLQDRTWYHHGAFEWDTGIVNAATGYKIFRNWADAIAAGTTYPDETETGLFAGFSQAISKKDPAGGTLASRELGFRGYHYSGFDFERLIGTRRIGSMGMDIGAAVGGPGFVEVQRSRACLYTSDTFAELQPFGTVTDNLTSVEFFPTKTLGSFPYQLTFKIPKWGERVADGPSAYDKGQTNTIFASFVVGNILVLDMDLQQCGQAVQVDPGVPPENIPYDTGGLFCLGENVQQDTGPFSSFPFGDRNMRCSVGDVITLTVNSVEYKLAVVSTLIFRAATSEDTTKVAPNANTPGITQTIIDYHQRCDRILCELDPNIHFGIIEPHQLGGSFVGLTVSSVKMEAVCPPRILYNGSENPTGYDPVVYTVDIDNSYDVVEMIEGSDYIFDPVLGEIHMKETSLPVSLNIRLHYKGHCFHTKPTLYAEDLVNCNVVVDSLLEGYAVGITGEAGGVICSLSLNNGVDPVVEYLFIDPKGHNASSPDPQYDWNFPDDSEVNVSPTEYNFDAFDIEWHTVGGTGGTIGSFFVFQEDMHIQFTCRFPVVFLPVLLNITVDEVTQCFLDISLENGSMTHHTLTNEYPIINWRDETTVSTDDVDLKILTCWYEESGGTITLTKADESLSIANNFKKVTVNGTDYLRATADITACQKAAITSKNANAGKKLVLIPFPAAAIPEDFDVGNLTITGAVYSATVQYDGSDYDPINNAKLLHIETWQITFDAMSIGAMHYRINKDELRTIDYTDELNTPDLTYPKPIV